MCRRSIAVGSDAEDLLALGLRNPLPPYVGRQVRPHFGLEPVPKTVAATAALTAIMGREAIYKRRMVTWKELGVTV